MFRNLALVLLLTTLPLSAAENVSAFGPVARANISAIGPVAIANVSAIGAVDNTGSGVTLVQDSDFSTATGSDNDPISTLTATVGKDLTAAGDVRPTLQTAERNGLNVGRFDGTDDTMATAAFDANVTQPCVILMVFKLNVAGTVNQRFISSIAEETGGERIVVRFDSAPAYQLWGGINFFGIWGNNDPNTSWHVMATCVNGASTLTILDTGTAETITSDPGPGILSGLRISGDYDGTINPTSVDVGQIRIWQGAMDATALAAEISTMRTKWGF